MGGDFVIFQKTSMYNRIGATYDGRHNQMTTDEFRHYIIEKVRIVESIRENTEVQNFVRESHISMDDVVFANLNEMFRQEHSTKYQRSYLDYCAPNSA
jgi:hypothetical protein